MQSIYVSWLFGFSFNRNERNTLVFSEVRTSKKKTTDWLGDNTSCLSSS